MFKNPFPRKSFPMQSSDFGQARQGKGNQSLNYLEDAQYEQRQQLFEAFLRSQVPPFMLMQTPTFYYFLEHVGDV